MSLSRPVVAALVLCVAAPSAYAITAKDVMEMSVKERFSYLTGLADMLSYQHVLSGDRTRAECITNAFYSQKDETWDRVHDTMRAFPDKAPEGLLVVLMNKQCGG